MPEFFFICMNVHVKKLSTAPIIHAGWVETGGDPDRFNEVDGDCRMS